MVAAARTLPTPPPVPSYPLPSPSKKDLSLKPNPHPYAIKTTSTALLSRSNSSGYNVNATHNYYIPTSPSPSRSDSGKSHRSTKSLTSVPESPSRESPRPLPIPPALESPTFKRDGSGGSGGYVSADEHASMPRRRPRRSETLPIIPLPSQTLTAPTPSVDDLPDNPKLWTPSQLATYLTTALRMSSNGKPGEIEPIGLPALVAKDIAAFTKNARIGGRTFLRLNEEDLEGLGMNKKWRDALLTAARNLRQNVLKGRIWGADGSPATSPSPQSASPPKLFSNPDFNSSSSSIESSASISADEEDGQLGAALGRSKARRYRSGRVRGMVESFERSGSFSSEGGLEDGDGGPADERARLRRIARQETQLTGQRVVESPSPSRRRPLPVPPSPSGSHHSRMTADEEPSMETLLAQMESAQPVTGARAWEAMDLAAGVTVKRLPSGGDTPAHLEAVPETIIGLKTITSLGSGRSSGSSTKSKGERRVVTAIFAPAGTDGAADALKPLDSTGGLEAFPSPGLSPEKKSRPLPPTPGQAAGAEADFAPVPITDPVLEPDTLRIERFLEEEIVATRALLDIFRARLEIVEQKVADMEVKEAIREREEVVAKLHASAFAPALESKVEHTSVAVEVGVQSALTVVDVEIQSDAMPQPIPSDDLDASTSGALVPLIPSSEAKPPDASSTSALQSVTSEVVRRLHAPASSLFSSSPPSSEVGKRKDEKKEAVQPVGVGDLPSYVLLVGLGMCAVVIQVVLRRVVGKGGGLRP
ncbi:hypothetical protein L226DRAFT_263814 [Lentinus tigrinus ALCF2SS1-7]|uniref:SAM domain-containing protein n=1 Tax=Lentinus tigrinus ALCF2SS1-6 TaxID=1328759 RepID=A0A5C2RU98_9APHY|nr:hypothetical protein L227DRAFT_657306 [Lentinus tigrinus ALCF2SS1-6]RPD69951.1 hypothetical protein L226DRAFT_263814 [Lentinus tigrinus ALCF2SS1-7]